MAKKIFLSLTTGLSASVLALWFSTANTDIGHYAPRLSSHIENESAIIDGAYEYQKLLKGDYTKEDWLRAMAIAGDMNQDRSTFNWVDHGPDNVGGRTRAIVVDRENINHIYAGSVSGGLFESFNRGNTWRKVEEFADNLAISSMCQTIDGTFYIATGHEAEENLGTQNAYDTGANGHGIYRSENDGSWSLIPETETHGFINEVVCDDVNNIVWYASWHGLKKYSSATGSITDVDAFSTSGSCKALSISKDGNVIIGHQGFNNRVYVSNNGGATFTQVSDIGETGDMINMAGVNRIEFAISHEKTDGNYRVYGSAADDQLKGIWRSADNGMNWSRIAPEYDGSPGGFAPFTTGANTGQGRYDNIITVVPGAPDRILLGGINCYSWSAAGNWKQISLSFLSPVEPLYVHADNHEFVWDETGRLYIGNDGGISISNNANSDEPEFYPANRGYNVTQFYATGVSAHGDVIGGTQDNGTKANYHDGTTYQEHKTVGGSDGFSSNISFINRDILFTSFFYSAVFRSSDRGENSSMFVPPLFTDAASPCTIGGAGPDNSGCGQFFTNFEMWEHPNDLASKDSVHYVPSQDYSAGDEISIPSATTWTSISYITPTDVVFDDTVNVDPALTVDDTIAVDLLSGNNFNLGILDWEFIDGAPEISPGDSIRIFGVEIIDTIIIEEYSTIDHYWGTNPLRPGKRADMGNDEQIYDIAWDTLIIQDPYQSWFALDMGIDDNGGGIWMTRNALRFSNPAQGWFRIKDSLTDETIDDGVSAMEFSKDGNFLFIGTFKGKLYRYTGFNEVYSPTEIIEGPTISGITYDTLVDVYGEKYVTKFEEIASIPGTPITGIASGPVYDPEYLVITLGRYAGSGKVQECTNAATGVSPAFTPFTEFPGSGPGAAGPGIPCYSVIVDRNDINTILVGTEFGVFATENGGSTWSDISGDFGRSPVYDMQQNWRTWNEGCRRPGEIYIGTHGRGIWSTDALLSTPDENDHLVKNKFAPNLTLYPNPLSENGTLEFQLEESGDVTLQIFNLNGQLMTESLISNLSEGKNQISFDTTILPKGTYVLRLNGTTFTETTKFIRR